MSEDAGRKTAIIVGAVAAAAGIAAASYVIARRVRLARADRIRPQRSVREVLSDCYARMREIQQELAELGPSAA